MALPKLLYCTIPAILPLMASIYWQVYVCVNSQEWLLSLNSGYQT